MDQGNDKIKDLFIYKILNKDVFVLPNWGFPDVSSRLYTQLFAEESESEVQNYQILQAKQTKIDINISTAR